MIRGVLLAGIAVLGLSATAQGAVLTFDALPVDYLTGAVTENGFKVSVLSGKIFVGFAGNPGNDVKSTGFDSGVLRIVASDGNSPTFLFSGLDYGSYSYTFVPVVQTLVVTGLLGGNVVGTDSYTKANTIAGSFENETPSLLAGVVIDELRVAMSGGYAGGGEYYQAVDNVTLSATAVPEPASLALLGMGVAGVAAVRRRRRAA